MDDASGCERVLRDVSAYLDGELAQERAAEIERHLESCVSCRAAYERERALVARVKTRKVTPAPPDVARRIRERLLEEDEREGGGPGGASS